MTEVSRSRVPAIAIGAAALALSTSLIAVVVVATRSAGASAAGPDRETGVQASELMKLRRGSIEVARVDGQVIGARVVDAGARAALGLEEGDVITNLAGRAITREADVHDAVDGAANLGASIVHADVVRDGEALHLRWRVSGELRASRRDGTLAKPDPFDATPGRDPLLDTIRKLGEFHYIVPRSTIERIVANADDFSKGARVVPAMKGGLPEGFKVYAVRPGSLFAAVGLENGDTIRAVNGYETTSLDKVMEAYLKVKDAKELAIDITRRGKYELISISIQ